MYHPKLRLLARGRTKAGRKRQVLLALVICLLLGAVGFLIDQIRSAHYLWQERVNVAIAADAPVVVTFNRTSREVTAVFFPDDTYLEVPGGFGKNRVGKVWSLAAIVGNYQLFPRTVGSFLGVPIDSWIGPKSGKSLNFPKKDRDDVARHVADLIIPLTFGHSKIITNLSFLERFYLWYILSYMPRENYVFVDLAQKGILVSVHLPDGTEAMVGDPDLVDKISQTVFFEKMAQQDDLSFKILNATDTVGAGKKIARVLTNLGYHVTHVENAARREKHCQIEIGEEWQKNESVRRLARTLACTLVSGDVILDHQTAILTIGDDLASIW